MINLSGKLCTALVVGVIALATQWPTCCGLECYQATGIPNVPKSADKIHKCEEDEHYCFEYEGIPTRTPNAYWLVYHAGCTSNENFCKPLYGRPVSNQTLGCNLCKAEKCNDKLIDEMRANNLICYNYAASYDKDGTSATSGETQSYICPTGETECFQVHYPAGSNYQDWTKYSGGCGGRAIGCTRETAPKSCDICTQKMCNLPKLPPFEKTVASLAADQSGDRSASPSALMIYALLMCPLLHPLIHR